MVHEGGKAMKFGTGFALTAQADPIALRDMAQTLDGEGFDYVTTAGHLLCAPPDSYPGRPHPTYVGPFREPLFLATLAEWGVSGSTLSAEDIAQDIANA
jgi:alkanesulfonate monooxygenase SsuD/methylene tetrahydromethanopterin reductase-like flavin-dependent oxidoreductase (luciferase family)